MSIVYKCIYDIPPLHPPPPFSLTLLFLSYVIYLFNQNYVDFATSAFFHYNLRSFIVNQTSL